MDDVLAPDDLPRPAGLLRPQAELRGVYAERSLPEDGCAEMSVALSRKARVSLRALFLTGFTALALAAIAADDPPLEVEIATTDGRTVTGHLQTPTVRLKNDYGTHEIEARTVQRIAVSPRDTPGHDVIEFTDGHRVTGQIVSERFVIESDKAIESFSRDAIREIKAKRPKQHGLSAIVLGLITLSAMEIVLGIDNIIFLAIVAGRLPEGQQPKARRIGLLAALGTRILLLLSLSFLLGLTKPLFTIPDMPLFHDLEAPEVSIRDLILLAGGLFLIYKSVKEMHEKLEAARAGEE